MNTKTLKKEKFFFFFLFLSLICSSQEKIIKTGDYWYYYDGKAHPPIEWKKANKYNDSWKKGISPLGYGDSAAKTVISYGENPKEKDVTKFFKKTVRINNPYKYLAYSLNILRDDGAVVYLNGHEIMRSNMPVGKITNSTLANSLVVMSDAEKYYHKKLLLPNDFIIGKNTISVSIHKARRTSIDCIFDLELIGINDPKMLPDLLKERTIKNLSLESKLKDSNHKQDLREKDLKYQLLYESNNNIKILLYNISTLLIISLFGLLLSFKSFSVKKQKIESKLLEIKELNRNKDREMMNNSINSINNEQFLRTLKTQLENNLNSNSKLSKVELKNLIKQIDYNIGTNDNWENLKRHFNALHLGYYQKLTKLHPSLTETELRHCIFINLFMQTKEIANILHIDPKSVQASRYRIKKKMRLNEETDLKKYLLNILNN